LFGFVHDELPDQAAAKRLKQSLVLIPCDASPYFVPGHKFSLFRHGRGQETVTRCFGYFPVGDLRADTSVELHLPMSRRFANDFWKFCSPEVQRSELSYETRFVRRRVTNA
jgi:hypothetical protein